MFIRFYTLFLFVLLVANSSQHIKDLLVMYGQYATIEQYPHSARLSIDCDIKKKFLNNFRLHTCGASILNQRVLLTAAHCLFCCSVSDSGTNAGLILVGVGNSFTNFTSDMTYTVARFIIHPDFNLKTFGNDIALLSVSKDMTLGPKVQRVAILPTRPDANIGVVAGWGITEDNQLSFTLKMARLKILSTEDCYKTMAIENKGAFCAGVTTEGKDGYTGKGDSGSALVVQDYIQIGIVSFKKKSLSNTTTIYTDVSYHYEWIQEAVGRIVCRNENETDRV